MANWALNQVMELLQIKCKDMNFSETQAGWQEHWTNMPLVARAKKYAETQYLRPFDLDSYDKQFLEFNAAGVKQHKGNCNTQTTIPRKTSKKIMLSEILYLADTFVEKPGREMKAETYWKVLKEVTTNLVDDKEKNSNEVKDGRSAIELLAVEVNHELMENTPNANKTPLKVKDITEMDQMEWHSTLEDNDKELTEEVAFSILNKDNERDNKGDNEINAATSTAPRQLEIVLDDTQTSISVGRTARKTMTVRKAKLNPLALSDIVAKGHRKMVELDIPVICHRQKL
jgi:hypothetical protein